VKGTTDFAGLHGGQAGQHVLKILPGVDAEPAAVLDDGVEDGALVAGLDVAQKNSQFFALYAD
jgi:hypothetical protein